jgi:hypothetical protein
MTNKDRERLDLLLRETAEARDDDRYLFAQYAVIVGAAVVVITAMASVYYFTCSESNPNCHLSDKITPVSDWIYIGAPLLPIALIAYTIFISAIAVLRSYYLRTIELEIHDLTDQKDSRLQIPSWSHVTLEVTGQSHAGGLARLNLFLISGIVLLMVAECLCLAFGRIYDPRLKVFALTTDVFLAGFYSQPRF